MTQTNQPAGTPQAEINIDAALAAKLLAEQHPDLSSLPITVFDSGWDNAILRLGESYCLRIPRRRMAAPLIVNEQRWLPVLSEQLALPVPTPMRFGRPTSFYPWHWSVVPWLEGCGADQSPLIASQAARLGAFLRNLHQSPPTDFPRNPHRGIPLKEKDHVAQTWLNGVTKELGSHTKLLRDKWEQAIVCPIDIEPKILHGDLHPLNILSQKGLISGIIDWGDLGAGDIATDLACAYMLFPIAADREALFAAYGSPSPETLCRAEAWALFFGLLFLATGLVNKPRQVGLGRQILSNIID